MAIPSGTESAGKSETADTGRRRESKVFRREQLINATIDSVAKRGYAATTLADVAEGAGLSRGIVNFHFKSKEKLLLETLQFMSSNYMQHSRDVLAKTKGTPAERLRALVKSDFDKSVCNPRMVSAWFAFFAEAKSRPSYQELCWSRDDEFLDALTVLCQEVKSEGGYALDARKTASAIYAMLDGLWLRLMLSGRAFTRSIALEIVLDTLGSLFPEHFDSKGTPIK